MNERLITGALALATLSGGAFADARVRAVHASPDAPNVDVLVDGSVAFADAPFTGVTGYATLPADTYNVQVVPAGMMGPVVIDANLALASGVDYSVVAVGQLADIAPLVLIDDNTLDPANARVRFVHASPNAPAVDIALAGGGAVLFDDFSFTDASSYLSVAPGAYDLEVRLAGSMDVVLSLGEVSLSGNTVYSVFAMGLVGDDDAPLQAVFSVDAIPSPGALAVMAMGGLIAARRRRAA